MHILAEPRALAELAEIDPQVPSGVGDRFCGYGIMGLPFASGHVLALRRFPASSLGYGYSAVWHRDPGGRWTFWSDVSPQSSCARYFGTAIHDATRVAISVRWTGPRSLRVRVGDGTLDWCVTVRATAATVALTLAGGLLTDGMWRHPGVLRQMSRLTGRALGVGRVTLMGRAPNRQWFIANPQRLWLVSKTAATVEGVDLGAPGPLGTQAMLGDFAIPQRGVFSLGRAFFEPFDPRAHADAIVRTGAHAAP